MPFLQPSSESALTRATPVLGYTHSFTHTHTHSLTHYGRFTFSNSPILHVFGLWGKPEHPEETHADTGRTCKLHAERHPGSARTRTRDLLAVRQQCYPLSHQCPYIRILILMSILRKMGISGTALLWFESYLSDRSFRVSWRGEVSKSQLLATGVPQGSVLGPLLFSIYMSSLGTVIQKHGFSYHCYADDTQLYFSFQPDDPTVTARIAACLSDISSWMMDHHLQLNLAKTELLVFSANPSLHHNFSIQLGSSTITPSRTARNLGVVIDDQLSFTDHIATTARSCRFALYNIRKIRPFLSEQAAQLLVQALVLSRLDYCNALLAGLPACTIKPLQLIQNAAARVVFNEPKKAHVTPLFIRLHWLPIAARIKFKVLMFAYKTTTGTAPIYLNLLVQTYAPSRSLRSASERRLVVPSQRGTKSLSRTFSWTVPSWWNDLPISIRSL